MRLTSTPSLLFACLVALPTAASADAVSAPPTDCPAGSTARSCHGPPTCEPDYCTSDSDCASGACRAVERCISRNGCGGRVGTPVIDNLVSECTGGGCADFGTCEAVMLCIPTGSSSDAGPGGGSGDGGCGCRVTSPARGALPLAIGGLALGFLLLRRRPRS